MKIEEIKTRGRKENTTSQNSDETNNEGWTTVHDRRKTVVRVKPKIVQNGDNNTSKDQSAEVDQQPDLSTQQTENEQGQRDHTTPAKQ